jgi:peptide/nickel transport system permease protein
VTAQDVELGAPTAAGVAVAQDARRPVVARRLGLWVGGGLLGLVVALSIVVPAVGESPEAFTGTPFAPPSGGHPFGTDEFGRDIFVRTWSAGRLDLAVAAIGSFVPFVMGTAIGMVAGMTRRRWVDAVLMRLVDAVIAFPFVILALALVVILGTGSSFGPLPAGMPSVLLAFFIVNWTIFARLARAESLTLRQQDYIVAAGLLGYSPTRILLRHVAPTVVKTTATYAVATSVLVMATTAGLAFLGAGAQPPTAEWGAMIFQGRTVLPTYWWIAVFPGLAMAITALGISLVADSLIAGRHR